MLSHPAAAGQRHRAIYSNVSDDDLPLPPPPPPPPPLAPAHTASGSYTLGKNLEFPDPPAEVLNNNSLPSSSSASHGNKWSGSRLPHASSSSSPSSSSGATHMNRNVYANLRPHSLAVSSGSCHCLLAWQQLSLIRLLLQLPFLSCFACSLSRSSVSRLRNVAHGRCCRRRPCLQMPGMLPTSVGCQAQAHFVRTDILWCLALFFHDLLPVSVSACLTNRQLVSPSPSTHACVSYGVLRARLVRSTRRSMADHPVAPPLTQQRRPCTRRPTTIPH